MKRCWIACMAIVWINLVTPLPTRAVEWPPRPGLRVVFLGDSITQSGQYVRYIDAYLTTRFPDRAIEVINLGLSSETVSGTTEPGHPYPRPDVRTRLARALEMARPNLVFVCYGMNDGIYHPPEPSRTALYRAGIAEVVASVRQAGAEAIVGTPPPFDAVPIAARTVPLAAASFGYKTPYRDYDGVLGIYAGGLLDQRRRGELAVADIHGATRDALQALRVGQPTYTFAEDGVHPGSSGHWLIARAYLETWGATAEVDSATIDARNRAVIAGTVELIGSTGPDASLRFTWTTRVPMPHDPTWDNRLIAFERIDDRFNRHRLTVVGLSEPRYTITENDRMIGTVTREQLAEGLDLLTLPELSTNRRSAEVGTLVGKKHAKLRPAWLEAVGHGPPNFGKAIPLDQAQREADAIQEQIRALVRPAPISLTLTPTAG